MLNQELQVSKSIFINASKQNVWRVLTDPELIKEYLYGTETITDWKPGSDIVFQGEYQGHKYRDHGKILTNDHLKEIVTVIGVVFPVWRIKKKTILPSSIE